MPRPPDRLLHVGMRAYALAIDPSTGVELCRTGLRGQRMRINCFVYLSLDGERLHATTSGRPYCLDRATGDVRWHDQSTSLGTGPASLVSDGTPAERAGAPPSLLARAARGQAARRSAAT